MSDSFTVRFRVRRSGVVREYQVWPLRPDPGVAVAAWRLRRQDDHGRPESVCYDVRFTPLGEWACECLGYLRHGHCKHGRCIRAFLGGAAGKLLEFTEKSGNSRIG